MQILELAIILQADPVSRRDGAFCLIAKTWAATTGSPMAFRARKKIRLTMPNSLRKVKTPLKILNLFNKKVFSIAEILLT